MSHEEPRQLVETVGEVRAGAVGVGWLMSGQDS